MTKTVIEINGAWHVTDASGQTVGPFASNAAAWRWVDRQSGEDRNAIRRIARE